MQEQTPDSNMIEQTNLSEAEHLRGCDLRKLIQTAHQAGAITSTDHAEFFDWMSSEALANNIFCAAQTDAALKRDNVQGKERANTTHFVVASKVREFIIKELGGTPPEELPTPQKSIRQLEKEEQFRLKHKAQPGLFDSPQE